MWVSHAKGERVPAWVKRPLRAKSKQHGGIFTAIEEKQTDIDKQAALHFDNMNTVGF